MDIDDWLSDSDSGADSGTGEEADEGAGEKLVRWATLALDETGSNVIPVASSGTATPSDLVAKCQENATRRQKIQKLRELRKKGPRDSNGMAPPRGPAASGTGRELHPARSATEGRQLQKVRPRGNSDSEDEMENLYRSASRVQAKAVNPLQKGVAVRTSCIRFNPNHQPDLELSRSSRQVASRDAEN